MSFLKAAGVALLAGLGCYAAGAAPGMLLVTRFSSNRHEKSVEAAMTGIFFIGPAAALIGAVVTFLVCWLDGK